MRLSKWWQNFQIWVNYPFKTKQAAFSTLIKTPHFGKVCPFSRYPLHKQHCMCGVYTHGVHNTAQHVFRTAVQVVLTTLSLHTHTYTNTIIRMHELIIHTNILERVHWAIQHWSWTFDRQPPDYSFISLHSLNSKVIKEGFACWYYKGALS